MKEGGTKTCMCVWVCVRACTHSCKCMCVLTAICPCLVDVGGSDVGEWVGLKGGWIRVIAPKTNQAAKAMNIKFTPK